MSQYLKPHSTEWFNALVGVNPQQAQHTRQILSLAGRDDVCSTCGDDPAEDYKLVSEQASPGFVSTLRLCDDCLNIRRNMHGEKFVPFTN